MEFIFIKMFYVRPSLLDKTVRTYLICRARSAVRIATLDTQSRRLDRSKMALPVLHLKALAFWRNPAGVLAEQRRAHGRWRLSFLQCDADNLTR